MASCNIVNGRLIISADCGTSSTLDLTFARQGSCNDPITIQFTSLPSGITIPTVIMPAGSDTVSLFVVAASNAVSGNISAQVSGCGSQTIEGSITLANCGANPCSSFSLTDPVASASAVYGGAFPTNIVDLVATVSGSVGAVTYLWQVSSDGGSMWSDITGTEGSTGNLYSGFNTDTLTIDVNDAASIASINNYRYRCVVTDTTCGQLTSGDTLLVVTAGCVAPTCTMDQTVWDATEGGSISLSFTVLAGTTSGGTYQWQKSYDNGGSWVNVTDGVVGGAVADTGAQYTNSSGTLGAATDLLITDVQAGMDGGANIQYRVQATNCSITNTSDNTAELIVTDPCVAHPPTILGPCVVGTVNYDTRLCDSFTIDVFEGEAPKAIAGPIYLITDYQAECCASGITSVVVENPAAHNVVISQTSLGSDSATFAINVTSGTTLEDQEAISVLVTACGPGATEITQSVKVGVFRRVCNEVSDVTISYNDSTAPFSVDPMNNIELDVAIEPQNANGPLCYELWSTTDVGASALAPTVANGWRKMDNGIQEGHSATLAFLAHGCTSQQNFKIVLNQYDEDLTTYFKLLVSNNQCGTGLIESNALAVTNNCLPNIPAYGWLRAYYFPYGSGEQIEISNPEDYAVLEFPNGGLQSATFIVDLPTCCGLPVIPGSVTLTSSTSLGSSATITGIESVSNYSFKFTVIVDISEISEGQRTFAINVSTPDCGTITCIIPIDIVLQAIACPGCTVNNFLNWQAPKTTSAGSTMTITASAFFPAVIETWQWQFNDGSGWQDVPNGAWIGTTVVSGATTYKLTLATIDASINGYDFRVRITCCSSVELYTSYSGTIPLTVTAGPVCATALAQVAASYNLIPDGVTSTSISLTWDQVNAGAYVANSLNFDGISDYTLSNIVVGAGTIDFDIIVGNGATIDPTVYVQIDTVNCGQAELALTYTTCTASATIVGGPYSLFAGQTETITVNYDNVCCGAITSLVIATGGTQFSVVSYTQTGPGTVDVDIRANTNVAAGSYNLQFAMQTGTCEYFITPSESVDICLGAVEDAGFTTINESICLSVGGPTIIRTSTWTYNAGCCAGAPNPTFKLGGQSFTLSDVGGAWKPIANTGYEARILAFSVSPLTVQYEIRRSATTPVPATQLSTFGVFMNYCGYVNISAGLFTIQPAEFDLQVSGVEWGQTRVISNVGACFDCPSGTSKIIDTIVIRDCIGTALKTFSYPTDPSSGSIGLQYSDQYTGLGTTQASLQFNGTGNPNGLDPRCYEVEFRTCSGTVSIFTTDIIIR